jgi:assimilatory nitrate reductase catalytic subunit
MGGREVGGLANQLAAHMGFTPPDIDRVRRFWKASRIATHEGLKAVQMFEAIARGEIKALWVIGTNPAVSLPDADAARAALKKLELFVVSENVRSNDTVNAGAHVLLPAQAWGEKSGTVTNSERRISRQRAFLAPAGEARPDWWILSEVAKRLGFGAAFDFNSAADVFREHAALSAFENNGGRDFDIGALRSLSDEAFDALTPVQWPTRQDNSQPQPRFFANGGFFSSDFKARFIAPEIPALRTETTAGRPLRLNTGRIRDQWHTMTRSGLSPRLGQHLPEPFVEVHPDDALKFGVTDGSFARVTTDHGQCTLKVVVSERQQRGMLFAPIHWSEATATGSRVGALVAPFTAILDRREQGTPASITPYEYVFGASRCRAPARVARPCLVTRSGSQRLRLPARRQCRSNGMAVLAGRWPARSPNASFGGVYAPRAAADRIEVPVHQAGAGRATGTSSSSCSRPTGSTTSSAACCCRANRPTGWPVPVRSSAPASASAAPRSATRLLAVHTRPRRSAPS